jgi:DNA-binding NtrC family response regulator
MFFGLNGRHHNRKAPMNILLIDDERSQLDMLETIIARKYDYGLFMAISAQEAKNVLCQNQINIIISDICMPGLSGIEFVEGLGGIYINIKLCSLQDMKSLSMLRKRSILVLFLFY